MVPSRLTVSTYLLVIDLASEKHAISWKNLCDERYLCRSTSLLGGLCYLFQTWRVSNNNSVTHPNELPSIGALVKLHIGIVRLAHDDKYGLS